MFSSVARATGGGSMCSSSTGTGGVDDVPVWTSLRLLPELQHYAARDHVLRRVWCGVLPQRDLRLERR